MGHKVGALRVWHIPQIPMGAFYVYVGSIGEAKTVLNALSNYDYFQLENHIKPDYANANGLEVWDGEDWSSWSTDNGDSISDIELDDPLLGDDYLQSHIGEMA